FADAVLPDIGLLCAVEADADAARQEFLVVEGTLLILAQAVGQGVGHGEGLTRKSSPALSRSQKPAPAALMRRRSERRPAPRHKGSVPETLRAFAVEKGRAVGLQHLASSGLQHGVAGGRVPLHGRAPTRIDISLAERHPAEFQ